jgi:hypothetical protein
VFNECVLIGNHVKSMKTDPIKSNPDVGSSILNHEQQTLPEHPSLTLAFSGVRGSQFLAFV